MNSKILESARALGENLRQSEPVQAYLKAKAEVDANPQLTEQENYLLDAYQVMALRQQNGNQLMNDGAREYNRLRNEFQHNPLILSRDRSIGPLQSLFSATASEITFQLGVDFTKLALAPEN